MHACRRCCCWQAGVEQRQAGTTLHLKHSIKRWPHHACSLGLLPPMSRRSGRSPSRSGSPGSPGMARISASLSLRLLSCTPVICTTRVGPEPGGDASALPALRGLA